MHGIFCNTDLLIQSSVFCAVYITVKCLGIGHTLKIHAVFLKKVGHRILFDRDPRWTMLTDKRHVWKYVAVNWGVRV